MKFEAGAGFGGSTSPGAMVKERYKIACFFVLIVVVVALCASGERGSRTVVENVGLYDSVAEVG